MHHGLHHRMRRHHGLFTLSSKPLVALMDVVTYVAAVAGPLFAADQAVEIWFKHNAGGVSLTTWGALTALSIMWMLYGLLHKEKVIVLSNVLWFTLDAAVVVGTL